ncbi:zonadhesin-like isoform X4 [Ostrinia nubilalis]|uniref:zonadhesin-like isoform X4 n=1 Tax=Ostrinia nubilalis TaxID=29057 RepID=UPI0030824B0F
MAWLLKTIILFAILSFCAGTSPPKKKPKCKPPRCNKNEHYVVDSVACEKTCANRKHYDTMGACRPFSKCVCSGDLMRLNDDATGPCVTEDQCPSSCCNENEHYVVDSNACEKTCANRKIYHLMGACMPASRCMCNGDLMRLNDDATGPCVTEDQCHLGGDDSCPDGDRNATRQECASWCQPTCSRPVPGEICPAACLPRGCVCKEGYILAADSKCIAVEDCPPGCNGDANATVTTCTTGCPATCTPNDRVCPAVCGPIGCACLPGYVLSDEGKCILKEDCPAPTCNENEYYVEDSNACDKTCANRKVFDIMGACKPYSRCMCAGDLMRLNDDATGPCVTEDQCPPSLECGLNEVASKDKIVCPPQTCESIYASFYCPPRDPEPGCNCINGYLRNRSNICIPSEQCPDLTIVLPTCGPNEIAVQKKYECPPQTCGRDLSLYNCDDQPSPAPGCICIKGYLRNSTGDCIPRDQCSTPVLPTCGPNEIAVQEKYECPPQTCDSILSLYNCENQPPPKPGCICIDEYLRNSTGDCIPSDQCPNLGGDDSCPDGDRNATRQECASWCQPTCSRPVPGEICPAACLPRGCVCKEGYILAADGKCIAVEDCPPGCNGDANATVTTCTTGCPATCTPNDRVCPAVCGPIGCACLLGYVLSDEGKCILKEDCPDVAGCGGDPNAELTMCTSGCPPTCGQSDIACPDVCGPPGCQCKSGYVLSDGKCILPQNCPIDDSCPDGDKNATRQDCPSSCQPTCQEPMLPDGYLCIDACLPRGCVCKSGYILSSSNGQCIAQEDCPQATPICGENEVYTDRKYTCPPQSCDSQYLNYLCAQEEPRPGCVCKDNYLRNGSGNDAVCIPIKQCPPGPIQFTVLCGENEVKTDNKRSCPPETCESIGRLYKCAAEEPTQGCKCIDGYYRDTNNKCIPKDQCPKDGAIPSCDEESSSYERSERSSSSSQSSSYSSSKSSTKIGPKACKGDRNATYTTCTSKCPARCGPSSGPSICPAVCGPPGCQCKKGYILAGDKCVLPRDCPPTPSCHGDRNATYKVCPSMCQPTCKQPVLNVACVQGCAPDGCVCKPGYVLSDEKKCILPKDCPGCKGDRNATLQECPSYCPLTCEKPVDTAPCPAACAPEGCVCNRGYLLSNGQCVLPKDCPGGSPTCPANEQYVNCHVECPNSYCPVNDNRGILICDPPFPCPAGCSCKAGYKRKSYEDRTCIEYSSCPPVNCTRPNEVWNPKPPNCIAERCEDATNPQPCNRPYPNYTPQCVCKEGYYRNASDICVKRSECPVQCSIPVKCRPTCAVPNPRNCSSRSPAAANVDGCECQEGYILSEVGGKCIKIEDCPQDQSCNGDPHARIKPCPWACPATCDSPNASNCDKKCGPVGCECQEGYIFSKKDGKCILPDDCPGGNPCGVNGTFVDCGFRCPNQYCPQDDSRIQIACKPGRPCPPGCACKINHKRLSYENDICIEAADCPPVDCTRPNEVWDPCPSDCLDEDCSNAYNPVAPCYTLLLNCQPKCVCKKGHYRNGSDICVPASECNVPNACTSDCAPTCANPNPNCFETPRCCEPGLIQLHKGIKCTKIEDCPKKGCNGDPNAVIKSCPAPCPSTCSRPNSIPCRKACIEVGCECAPGYIYSEDAGKCVKPDACPGGNPCGPNGMFVGCKNSCPTDYCPVDDSRATPICETYPFAPCNSGCVCNYGYIKNNRQEDKCILPNKCPPVKCKRPNERWDSCPSACLAEGCQDVNNQPTTCNTLVANVCRPRCVCNKGYFRNSTDICVPACNCDI